MTHPDRLTSFRTYLSSLPEELLTSLTRCYIWLAELRFTEGRYPTGLDLRRNCCLEECARRRRKRGRGSASCSSRTYRVARR